MKKLVIVFILIIAIALSTFVTYKITYKNEDIIMIESFVRSFGWIIDEEIFLPPKDILHGSYTILKDNIEPNNLEGLQLNLDEDDKYEREMQLAEFNLKERGLYNPLSCWVLIEDHKIVGIAIQARESEYYRDRAFYPINFTHEEILEDLKRQQSIGPFQGEE